MSSPQHRCWRPDALLRETLSRRATGLRSAGAGSFSAGDNRIARGGTPVPELPHSVRTRDRLTGRSAETAVLASFVGSASSTGAALLVTGEPGVGKSVLLDATAQEASASGATVLRAGGVEFEAEISFAGLHQVLLPLLDEVECLPEPHREALTVPLGLSRGPVPARLLVSAASLALLRNAAASRPVLKIGPP